MRLPELFENEELITESEDGQILLTTKRIRHFSGSVNLTSIMLEKVSSTEVNYSHYPVLLLLGFLCLLYSVTQQGEEQRWAIIALVTGAILIITYFLTRKHVVIISSDGGAKIVFRTSGMSSGNVMAFVNKVEEAKNKLKS